MDAGRSGARTVADAVLAQDGEAPVAIEPVEAAGLAAEADNGAGGSVTVAVAETAGSDGA